jgi:recombination protein RecA
MAARKTKKKAAQEAETKKASKEKKPVKTSDLTADLVSSLSTVGSTPVFVLGSDSMALKIRGVISTQCPTIDAAIGRGGIPLARLTVIHGGEGGGKTTLALHICAEVQKQGGLVVYMDKEYKLDPDYAKAVGVDTNKFIINQPETLEDTCTMALAVITRVREQREATGKRFPVLIVLDSINATQSKDTIANTESEKQYPNEARIWSQRLPEVIKQCAKEDIALLFISQVRQKLNVMFGDDAELAGGKSIKFHASLIMFVRRIGSVKVDGVKVGNEIEVECKKNQIFRPFGKARCRIIFGKGFDRASALLIQSEEEGLIKHAKGHFTYKGESIGRGREAAIDTIDEDEELQEELNTALRERWNKAS